MMSPELVKGKQWYANMEMNTEELEKRLAEMEKAKAQKMCAKDCIFSEMNASDIEDVVAYEMENSDLQLRQRALYSEITDIDRMIHDTKADLQKQSDAVATVEVARQMMKEAGDELAADHTTDMGKKLMLQAMIERVDLFPERLHNGRYVKGVTFKFPVMLEGEMTDQWWYKESTVEALVMTEDEISRDPAHFISILKKAADAGEGYGALLLAQAYMYGDHVQADQALAVKYLQKAAERNIPDALAYLAHQYFGLGLPGDARRARKLLSEADVYCDAEICEEIEDGIMDACRGRIPKDALKPFWFLHEKKIRRQALRDPVGRQAARDTSDPVINAKLETIMARLDQLTVVSLDTNMRTRSLEAGMAEIYRFMITDLARQLQEEKMRLRSQAYEEEKEARFFERMDAWISSRVKSADSLADEQTHLLEAVFGDVWDLLLPESRASLVSAHVLYESCREIRADGFDFSGICISATSALEGEIRRRLYNDFMTWMQNAGIEETEIEYVRGKVTKSFGFTLGCVPYVFGVKASSQTVRERVQNQFFPYMQSILADHACPDVYALFCSTAPDAFVQRSEEIREQYRNKAAHVENMTREEAQACMLAVTDLLLDFYHLLDPQVL